MEAADAYCVLMGGCISYENNGKSTRSNYLYEVAQNCFAKMNRKHKLVLDYVFHYDCSTFDKIVAEMKIDCDRKEDIVALALFELQKGLTNSDDECKNRPFSKRQLAKYLDINRETYRKDYAESFKQIKDTLHHWFLMGEDYARRQ